VLLTLRLFLLFLLRFFILVIIVLLRFSSSKLEVLCFRSVS
jgi:hypothetical protein